MGRFDEYAARHPARLKLFAQWFPLLLAVSLAFVIGLFVDSRAMLPTLLIAFVGWYGTMRWRYRRGLERARAHLLRYVDGTLDLQLGSPALSASATGDVEAFIRLGYVDAGLWTLIDERGPLSDRPGEAVLAPPGGAFAVGVGNIAARAVSWLSDGRLLVTATTRLPMLPEGTVLQTAERRTPEVIDDLHRSGLSALWAAGVTAVPVERPERLVLDFERRCQQVVREAGVDRYIAALHAQREFPTKRRTYAAGTAIEGGHGPA